MKLLVVIPFCRADQAIALNLLSWIEELGRLPENPCLIVADAKLSKEEIQPVVKAALKIFQSVEFVATPFFLPDERWPIGANWMFETAIRHIGSTSKRAFLWMEPDCVPVRETWLSEVEGDYDKAKRPFMGQIILPGEASLPEQVLSGCAVYPGVMPREILARLIGNRQVAWDVSCASIIAPQTHHSPLFWTFHNHDSPPTFVVERAPDGPRNAIPLDKIPKRAAIVHAGKDGTLIGLLRERRGQNVSHIESPGQRTIWHVVQRFHQRDADAQRRVRYAFESWVNIYGQDFRPLHLWEFSRTSEVIGDERKLPYLRDVLKLGMRRAKSNDALMLTNDDTVLHPEILGRVKETLEKIPAFCSFRVNYPKGKPPNFMMPISRLATLDDDIGRDVFVFEKWWLLSHMCDIPDFLLGELEWDLMLALLIRKSYGLKASGKTIGRVEPACELPKGYVWHERHERAWIKSGFNNPSKQHNWKLSAAWCENNGIEYPFE